MGLDLPINHHHHFSSVQNIPSDTKTASHSTSTIDKKLSADSNNLSLELKNAPSPISQSPFNNVRSVPGSSLASFIQNEGQRPVQNLEIVDLIDEMNDVNKALIDSIVKPAFLSTKFQEQKHSTQRKPFTPIMNINLKDIERPNGVASFDDGIKHKDYKPLVINTTPEIYSSFFTRQAFKENRKDFAAETSLVDRLKQGTGKKSESRVLKEINGFVEPLATRDLNIQAVQSIIMKVVSSSHQYTYLLGTSRGFRIPRENSKGYRQVETNLRECEEDYN